MSLSISCAVFEYGLMRWTADGAALLTVAEPTTDTIIRTGVAEITLPRALVAEMAARRRHLTQPPEWAERFETVPGASKAVWWHGVRHIFDQNDFRRLDGPFPEKDPLVLRILVVGDSLTYGTGVPLEWAWPSLLQNILSRTHHVEVMNLGISGAQSEDIALTLNRFIPRLKPDLVIYGVFCNDFLASHTIEGDYEWRVPLPEWLKDLLIERTRLTGFVVRATGQALIGLGIKHDIFDEILAGLGTFQRRFREDVHNMSQLAVERGLPPIVAMVLDQFPAVGGRSQKLTHAAEAALRSAGFDVIETNDFYRDYDGHFMVVSPWEGHPSEEAHAIFATRVADHLLRGTVLDRVRR